MNDKDEILKGVSDIFKRELEDPGLIISYTSSPDSIEKWDSITNLILINAIEETYQISFPVDVIFKIEKVGDICDFIAANGKS